MREEKMSEKQAELLFWDYVEEHGTEIPNRKCLFNHDQLCDLTCVTLKVGFVREPKQVTAFCTKFRPPRIMAKIEIVKRWKG